MKDTVDPICHLLSSIWNLCLQLSNLSIDHPTMTMVVGASPDPILSTYRWDHWLVALGLLDEQVEQVRHEVLEPVLYPSVVGDPKVCSEAVLQLELKDQQTQHSFLHQIRKLGPEELVLDVQVGEEAEEKGVVVKGWLLSVVDVVVQLRVCRSRPLSSGIDIQKDSCSATNISGRL